MPSLPQSPNPSDLSIPVAPGDHSLGPADAPLTLLEYGDYECPDCFNAQPIVKALRAKLGDRLRFVFRHFPQSSIHARASTAALAAEAAAAQHKFWEMHDALFEHQRELATLDLTHLALTLGLEVYGFARDMETEHRARRIRTDFDGALASGVHGTPTFFINGKRYTGPAAFNPLLAALQQHLPSSSS